MFFLVRFRRFLLLCGLIVASPIVLLNVAVSICGETLIFPLSPFFLEQKWAALKAYGKHRIVCLIRGGHTDANVAAHAAERRHGLPTGLMRAIVKVESNAQAHRISSAGAMGPAQLMPSTARMLGVDDPFDTQESIDAGARYVSQHLKRTKNVRLAVASYNAGPGAVRGRVPQNGETEFYVARVMRHYRGR